MSLAYLADGRISSVHENKAGVSIVSSHPNKIQLKEAFVQHHSQLLSISDTISVCLDNIIISQRRGS
jgi:hypothetical protein